MIDALLIENVQSIKKLVLPLGKVTVFTGPTEAGKSAVIRALDAFLTNSYKASLLRWGETRMRVGVVAEGRPVGFIKGDKSCYFIGTNELSKSGKEIPIDVRRILRLDPIVFDQDVVFLLNITGQHDHEFLVEDKASTLSSRVIGRLSSLGMVYSARRVANNDMKTLGQQITVVQSEVAGLQEDDSRFEHIFDGLNPSEVSSDIDKIGQTEALLTDWDIATRFLRNEESVRVLTNDIPQIKEDLAKIEAVQQEGIAISVVARVWKDIDTHFILSERLLGVVNDFQHIDDLSKRISTIVSDIQAIGSIKKQADKIPDKMAIAAVYVDIGRIEEDKKRIDTLASDIATWKAYNNALSEAQRYFMDVIELQRKIKEEEAKLKVCPMCKQPISEETRINLGL